MVHSHRSLEWIWFLPTWVKKLSISEVCVYELFLWNRLSHHTVYFAKRHCGINTHIEGPSSWTRLVYMMPNACKPKQLSISLSCPSQVIKKCLGQPEILPLGRPTGLGGAPQDVAISHQRERGGMSFSFSFSVQLTLTDFHGVIILLVPRWDKIRTCVIFSTRTDNWVRIYVWTCGMANFL